MKRVALALAIAILALALIDRVSLLVAPCGPGGGSRGGQESYENDNCATREGIVIAGIEWLRQQPPEAWTAISSLLIAIFTGTLWYSTDKLWRAGERKIITSRQIAAIQARQTRAQIVIAKESADAAKIAAESAKAAVLPSIGIHEIELCDPTTDNPSVHIRYSVTNYGGGVAIVNDIRSQIMLQVWRDGKMERISDGATATWNSVLPINTPSGFHIIALRMLTLKDLADIRDGSSSLRVYLEMTYRDTVKTRGDVQFSFTYDIRVRGFRLTPRQQQYNTESAD